MSKYKNLIAVTALSSCVVLTGCYSNTDSVLDNHNKSSALQLRSYQSRAYDTLDKNKTVRAVIATLQDLDFVLSKVDYDLGTISATKYAANVPLLMTVTVRERGDKQLMVRSNAQYGIKPIEEAKPYQDFFSALSKSLFLEGQEIG